MARMIRTLVRDDSGQDIIEYALLAAGIAVLLVPVVRILGNTLSGVFSSISSALVP